MITLLRKWFSFSTLLSYLSLSLSLSPSISLSPSLSLSLSLFLHRLYRDVKQKPRSNLLFVLSGGGKLNYFGTKSLLEEDNDDLGERHHNILWTFIVE